MGCEGAFCVRRSVSRLPAAEVPAPALRGFVAERRPITGTSLYLVLKSNGFHYPKIRLKKFGFSSKTVPTNIAQKLPSQRCSQPFLIAFSTSRTNGSRSLLQAKAGTHSAFGEGSHTAAYTPKQGAFRMGVVSLLLERSARSPTSPGRVSERQVLPLLDLGWGCSRKTQRACGAAMRLCASLLRGVAAPLGCVIFFASAEVAACTPCAQCFPNVRDEGWYHYPRRALRVVETLDGRLSKRFICRFLASPIYICESSRRALPISASIQIACCWISRGHIACPWLIQA